MSLVAKATTNPRIPAVSTKLRRHRSRMCTLTPRQRTQRRSNVDRKRWNTNGESWDEETGAGYEMPHTARHEQHCVERERPERDDVVHTSGRELSSEYS
mgnify:CR=1 FL=1